MKHYAKILNGKVIKVIVAESGFFDTFTDDSPGKWIETTPDNSLRKNYAGVGYEYDKKLDAFIAEKKFESWVLNEEKGKYEPPSKKPKGEDHDWDEETKSWKKSKKD
jgi:hypothetical protein